MMEELFERFLSAVGSRNVGAAADVFADDAIVLRPGHFIEGRRAIEEHIADRLAIWRYVSGSIAVTFERQRGDVVEVAGTETTSIAPHDGDAFVRRSHFLVTLRLCEDRKWRISLDATLPDPTP